MTVACNARRSAASRSACSASGASEAESLETRSSTDTSPSRTRALKSALPGRAKFVLSILACALYSEVAPLCLEKRAASISAAIDCGGNLPGDAIGTGDAGLPMPTIPFNPIDSISTTLTRTPRTSFAISCAAGFGWRFHLRNNTDVLALSSAASALCWWLHHLWRRSKALPTVALCSHIVALPIGKARKHSKQASALIAASCRVDASASSIRILSCNRDPSTGMPIRTNSALHARDDR
mmetsp:Transcript_29177/g.67163  ORF Transcript_29177/g.67163 Transcript_29177/m.67163 type:complete len:239 (-) Transcript_29177:364-1080(-)